MPEQHDTEWATIGTVVAPFGLRGELKVYALTDIPDRFGEIKNCLLIFQITSKGRMGHEQMMANQKFHERAVVDI